VSHLLTAGRFSSQTLRAVASWLFFRVAHSPRINLDMLVVSASAARTALKNSQLIRQLPDESHVIYGTGHWLLERNCERPMHHLAGRDLIENFASTFDSCNWWTKLVASSWVKPDSFNLLPSALYTSKTIRSVIFKCLLKR
jgi:hypothetical protein